MLHQRQPRALPVEPIQLRWQAFEGIRAALETMHGPMALERLRPRLPKEVADAVTFRTSRRRDWYPVSWYAALHDAAQAELGGGLKLHREIGRLATEHDLRTVYGFLLRLVPSRAILAQVQRVWNLYSDRGVVTVEELSPSRVRVHFEQCPGVSLPVWEDIASSGAAFLAGGKRTVTPTIVSVSTDHGTCVVQYDWAE